MLAFEVIIIIIKIQSITRYNYTIDRMAKEYNRFYEYIKVHLTPVRLFFYLKVIMFIRSSANKKIDLDKFLIFYSVSKYHK